MQSRISFFNPTVLKKDITRFAPVWGLYGIFSLLVVFLIWVGEGEPRSAQFASELPYILFGMGIMNFFYGGISALCLFSDLFQSKMAGMLHAMPMRREGWFLTHVCAGLLFSLMPNLLTCLIVSMLVQQYCYLAFIWLAVTFLQFVFFFSVGVFSVQCAGNRLGAIAVYGLINFLSVLAAFFLYSFYQPLLYGVVIDFGALCQHSPVVGFTTQQYVYAEYDNMTRSVLFEGFVGSDWRYLLISVAVGIALLGCAILLYRKRHMEHAGDLIAVKPVAPVFLTLYTLCAGAILYFISNLIDEEIRYFFLLIGFGIGFFTGYMLLEKKVNVFTKKKWLGFGLFSLAFFLTIFLTWLDPIGITRYVPNPNQVQAVHISPYESEYYLDNDSTILTDMQDIWAITDIHKELVTERNENISNTITLRLRYEMKNGTTVSRKYYVKRDCAATKTLKRYYSSFQCVTGFTNVDDLRNKIQDIEFSSYYDSYPYIQICTSESDSNADKFPGESVIIVCDGAVKDAALTRQLLDAIKADCESGAMAQMWDMHSSDAIGNINISYKENGRYKVLSINVFPDAGNTLSFLKSLATK